MARTLHLLYQIITTPIGEILVAGTPFAITHVKHGMDRRQLSTDFMMAHESVSAVGDTDYIKDVCGYIAEYLNGQRPTIDAAILLDGTEFQRKVWQELRQIPHGTTMSYSDIARNIGEPEAFRAVANACGDNPTPLIIPCHRVVNKSGEAGGFVWGKEIKDFLLALEQQSQLRPAVA